MAKKTDTAEGQAQEASQEVQSAFDEATAKGYFGTTPDTTPNDAYSIKTGPDAPPLATDDRTRFNQPAAAEEG